MAVNLLPLCLVTVLITSQSNAFEEHSYKALKFGETLNDYVKLTPNMRPFTSAFSICTWIKKLRSGSYPSWFSYTSEFSRTEIWINDDGSYNWIFDDHNRNVGYLIDLRMREWYHYCFCWDVVSHSADIYHNGRRSGSVNTPYRRRLHTDGFIVLGQDLNTIEGDFREDFFFGGELQKLNMFSKKLNSSEVREMYNAGRCSHIEIREGERYSRQLKWEQILKQPRSGNVKTVDSCPLEQKLHHCHRKVDELEEQLEEAQNNTDVSNKEHPTNGTTAMMVVEGGTSAELEELRLDLERTIYLLSETESQLEQTEERLERSETQVRKTESQLRKSKKKVSTLKAMLSQANSDLEDNIDLLRETRTVLREKEDKLEQLENNLCGANCFKSGNFSYWDILYEPTFLNKEVSGELLEILNNSWRPLENFNGAVITEEFIEFCKTNFGSG